MALENVSFYQVTASGGTDTVDATLPIPDFIALWNNAITLSANYELTSSGVFPSGTVLRIGINQVPTYPGGIPSLNLNGYTYTVFGIQITQEMLNNPFILEYHIADNGTITTYPIAWATVQQGFGSVQNISGTSITDGTLPLTALTALTSGRIIVGDATNVPTAVAMTGDVTISNAGVTAIGSGKVTNTMLAGSIARTKIVAGTANSVVINDGSGNLSSSATLSPTLGGTGQNNASATGFQKWSGGTSSVGTITGTLATTVQWGTGHVGDFKVRMGFAGTVTGYYAFLAQDLGSTDGVITLKNNAGTTMTGGVVTFSASSTKGSTQTATTSANNTFSAGDVLTFTTSGGGTSGIATISFDFTRNS